MRFYTKRLTACCNHSYVITDSLQMPTSTPAPRSLSPLAVDSTRLTALLDGLCRRGYPVMFVGAAGTGKTTLVSLLGNDRGHLGGNGVRSLPLS